MKTARIAKILSTAALVSLGLLAGTSQADNYGFHADVNVPSYGRHGPAFGSGQGPQEYVGQAIDQRQRAMMARIEHGMRTGRLTRYEARDLIDDLRRSEWLERRFEADGRLSRGEVQELDRLLDRLEGDLREDMHDSDRRGGRFAWR